MQRRERRKERGLDLWRKEEVWKWWWRRTGGVGVHRYRVRESVFVLPFAHQLMSTLSNLTPYMAAHRHSFMNKHQQQNRNVS